jgi:hypothetical protein
VVAVGDLDQITALADAVDTLLGWSRVADEHAAGALDVDLPGAAYLLDMARAARVHVSAVEQALTEHIAATWRREQHVAPVEVPGLGLVGVKCGAERKQWDHEALTSAVVDANLAHADGEVPDPFTVARWVTAAASPSYWRVGVLAALGVDVDDYCTRLPGRASVVITTPQKGTAL